MISTYILLLLIPYVVCAFAPPPEGTDELGEKSKRYIPRGICRCLQISGLIAHPVTYIALVKHYRDNLLNCWRVFTNIAALFSLVFVL